MVSAITNIIFAYPQPAHRLPPGVRVPQVGNHWDGRLGGPQSRSGRYGEDKIFYLNGTRTPGLSQSI
jgi:hypothetical protein